ncbi:hypothetical protein CL656_06925 [bacterium]|nr:hypothetical protein [bacterium]
MKYRYPFAAIGHRLEPEIFDILKEANNSMSTYTQGIYQSKFESDFQNKFGLKNCIAVSNAVSGIELIASELDLKDGDEIICPAHTYCASAYPFLKVGAKIIWSDINPKTWLSGPDDYREKITNKTKAIIVVHLYGLASEAYKIYDELKERGIIIIEDCAQSIGSKYNGIPVGSYADFSIFSFQSHKNISTLGEGGMIAVTDENSFARMIKQRHNGHTSYNIFPDQHWKPAMSDVRKCYSSSYPSNFCMNEFQAIVGSYLLSKIDEIISIRKKKWNYARNLLSNQPNLLLQEIPENSTSSYHLLPIRINIDISLIDEVFDKMKSFGIQCAKQYQPLYRYNLFDESASDETYNKKLLKNTDLFYDQMISLPFHESLSINDIEYMINSLIKSIQALS